VPLFNRQETLDGEMRSDLLGYRNNNLPKLTVEKCSERVPSEKSSFMQKDGSEDSNLEPIRHHSDQEKQAEAPVILQSNVENVEEKEEEASDGDSNATRIIDKI